MSTKSRRFLSYVPRMVGRVWNDVAPSLQDYLERLRDSVTNGIPGGFSDTTPSAVAPDNVADMGTEGSGWAPGDHTHNAPVGAPVALGTVASEGAANTFSRSDHVHPRAIEANGEVRAKLVFEDGLGIDFTVTSDVPNDEVEVRLVIVPVVLRPTQITADVNDYSPGTLGSDRTTIFISTDASRNITGLLATAIVDGVEIFLVNSGAQDAVLTNEDAASTAGNRFICPGAASVTLNATEAALIKRDGTSSRWRVFPL